VDDHLDRAQSGKQYLGVIFETTALVGPRRGNNDRQRAPGSVAL